MKHTKHYIVVFFLVYIIFALANNINDANWAVIDKNESNGDYTSLPLALAAGETNILLHNAVYQIQTTIILDRPDIHIHGSSKTNTILQYTGQHSFVVIKNTYNVTINHLTLDGETYDTNNNNIWETFGVVNSSWITLSDCIIYGSLHMFAVYFAGPYIDAGQATIDAFHSSYLDQNNLVNANIIYSNYQGDVLSFSLQKYGQVINNKVVGGVISFFMNRDSICRNNTIIDSNTWGIFISVPANNNYIVNNKIVNCQNSAIKVARQIDHLNVTTGASITPLTYRASGIKIVNNHVENSRFMGIEIDQTVNASVMRNKIYLCDYSGIYVLRSDEMKIINNEVRDIGQSLYRTTIHDWDKEQNSGFFGDLETINATIVNNQVFNNDETGGARFGIKISSWTENKGSLVIGNIIYGTYKYDIVSIPVDNVEKNNSNVQITSIPTNHPSTFQLETNIPVTSNQSATSTSDISNMYPTDNHSSFAQKYARSLHFTVVIIVLHFNF